MEYILIPVVISLIISIIYSFIYKGINKVDKGYAFNYYKLTYRRKMIRTITTLPILIVSAIYIYSDWSLLSNILFGISLLIFYLAQQIYNFIMWKKAES